MSVGVRALRKAFLPALLACVLAGCATYRDFDHLKPVSERAQEATLAAIERVGDDNPTDDVRDRRLAYLRWLQSAHIKVRFLMLETRFAKWTPEEHRLLEGIFEGAFELVEAYAQFPGEMDTEGNVVKRPDGVAFEERIASVQEIVDAYDARAD